MADYSISFARSARKELERLPASVAERILAKVEALAGNPRPVGVIKLHGKKNLWRMRVAIIAWFIRLMIFPRRLTLW